MGAELTVAEKSENPIDGLEMVRPSVVGRWECMPPGAKPAADWVAAAIRDRRSMVRRDAVVEGPRSYLRLCSVSDILEDSMSVPEVYALLSNSY